MIRSMKNAFAPVNRIPRDVLSIIPDYLEDGDLIRLTHVCHDWRELLISRPSLWTCLDWANVEKTRVYIERSKSSPLDVYLGEEDEKYFPFLNDAFLLTVPHLRRLRSLTLSGSSDNVVEIINTHLDNFPAPFLEKLKIRFSADPHIINAAILDRNRSSLRELRLSGVLTSLPWKNLANLTTFDFRQVPSSKISVTQLLDFFVYTPLLSKIQLWNALPTTSDAPLGRVVSLPRLKKLTIIAQPAHSLLLKHLSIPNGASLDLEFDFNSEKSPIPDYLPKTLKYLNNLSHITTINVYCNPEVSLRLGGPSGGLYIFGTWTGVATSLPAVYRRVLRSLNHFNISMTERFMITAYSTPSPPGIERPPPHQTLPLMKALHTLILIDCYNAPFVSALNPNRISSGALVCPKLEELVLYIKRKEWFCISELLGMVEERSSRGAALSTITIFSSQEFVPAKEVLKLRDHVSCVEYRLDDVVPGWDELSNDVEDFGYESDW